MRVLVVMSSILNKRRNLKSKEIQSTETENRLDTLMSSIYFLHAYGSASGYIRSYFTLRIHVRIVQVITLKLVQ